MGEHDAPLQRVVVLIASVSDDGINDSVAVVAGELLATARTGLEVVHHGLSRDRGPARRRLGIGEGAGCW